MIEEVFGGVKEVKCISDLPEFDCVIEATYLLHVLHVLILCLNAMAKLFVNFPADPLVFEQEFLGERFFVAHYEFCGRLLVFDYND